MINALIKIKNPKAQAIYKTLKNKREAIEYLLINAIEDNEFIEKYADKELLEFFLLRKNLYSENKINNNEINKNDEDKGGDAVTEVAF